jgi:hypothetical protein
MEKKCLLITKYMIQDTLDTGTTFLIQFEMCPLFQPPWTPVEDAAVNFVMLCLGTSSVHGLARDVWVIGFPRNEPRFTVVTESPNSNQIYNREAG